MYIYYYANIENYKYECVSGFKIDSKHNYTHKQLYIFNVFIYLDILVSLFNKYVILFRLGNVSTYCRGEKQSGYARSRNYPAVPKVGNLLFSN